MGSQSDLGLMSHMTILMLYSLLFFHSILFIFHEFLLFFRLELYRSGKTEVAKLHFIKIKHG